MYSNDLVMAYTPNDAEHLAYKERVNEVITNNIAVVDYSFDRQTQQWCQFVLQVIELDVPLVYLKYRTWKAEYRPRG